MSISTPRSMRAKRRRAAKPPKRHLRVFLGVARDDHRAAAAQQLVGAGVLQVSAVGEEHQVAVLVERLSSSRT
jgi:hypothetical protein